MDDDVVVMCLLLLYMTAEAFLLKRKDIFNGFNHATHGRILYDLSNGSKAQCGARLYPIHRSSANHQSAPKY